ncbi:hypothetical protein GCM10009544_02560 [Streptomyces stramineus]|uniref:4-hydroxy-3-methylbut-2-enyl diphosphate reductase n=1 Tax=Streptomyces stramineus TaxID=173861 RepID=A0ABP3J8V7_9ACTN
MERAIEVFEALLERHADTGRPVFVRKQIVHNVHVVRVLESRGAVFVGELDEVTDGSVVVFSAHGVSSQVQPVFDTGGSVQPSDATEAMMFAARVLGSGQPDSRRLRFPSGVTVRSTRTASRTQVPHIP